LATSFLCSSTGLLGPPRLALRGFLWRWRHKNSKLLAPQTARGLGLADGSSERLFGADFTRLIGARLRRLQGALLAPHAGSF